jgi:hypothetical protein
MQKALPALPFPNCPFLRVTQLRIGVGLGALVAAIQWVVFSEKDSES